MADPEGATSIWQLGLGSFQLAFRICCMGLVVSLLLTHRVGVRALLRRVVLGSFRPP